MKTIRIKESEFKNIIENTILKEHSSELNISDVISRLLSLQRFDIDPQDNGEFIELDERIEEDGRYINSEDLDEVISELKLSL